MSYFDHIHAHNNSALSRFRPFYVAKQRVGWISDDFGAQLAAWPEVFDIDATRVTLSARLNNFVDRSAAIETPLNALASDGNIRGWRGEAYPVMANWGDMPLMQIERAACVKLGIRTWGVHLNGIVRRDDGMHMWVAYRAKNKPTFPGMLDNMVAGGQPVGISPGENLIKECAEEARLPTEIATQARPVSVISYCQQTLDGVKPNQMFCYDLEVPADFTPVNEDGEVDRFELWPLKDVIASVRDSFDFKSNCNLVVIDFLVRHGYITPENEPDYIAVVLGLRSSA